jgi:sporulation protein YlmC with PRC-barrel domain
MTLPDLLRASSVLGHKIVDARGESLGRIEELVIDVDGGRVAYAVLSFEGRLGLGDRLHAVPWNALWLDEEHERFILDESKERLQKAPAFDKEEWPDMADPDFVDDVYGYYGERAFC